MQPQCFPYSWVFSFLSARVPRICQIKKKNNSILHARSQRDAGDLWKLYSRGLTKLFNCCHLSLIVVLAPSFCLNLEFSNIKQYNLCCINKTIPLALLSQKMYSLGVLGTFWSPRGCCSIFSIDSRSSCTHPSVDSAFSASTKGAVLSHEKKAVVQQVVLK